MTSVGNQIFIGQFYDENTSLNYLNARYYNAGQGQFISQDPSFLAVGDPVRLKEITGQDQRTFLSDPQQVNSTSYGRDNPITMKDPNGNFPFVIAALPWIYAAYTASQTAVDYYDYRNMNVTYANYTSPAQKAETKLKLGFDGVALVTGQGLERAGLQISSYGLDTMFAAKDAFDTRANNPLYRLLSQQRVGPNVSMPTMNFGGSNYGVVLSNVFSNSVQTRIAATQTFNAAIGGSGSGRITGAFAPRKRRATSASMFPKRRNTPCLRFNR